MASADDVEQVRAAYRRYLRREVDAEGLRLWCGKLANKQVTHEALPRSLVESEEGLRLYRSDKERLDVEQVVDRAFLVARGHLPGAIDRLRAIALLRSRWTTADALFSLLKRGDELPRDVLPQLGRPGPDTGPPVLTVKYAAAWGTGGYCRAAKTYIRALLQQNIAVVFRPILWYRPHAEPDEDDRLLELLQTKVDALETTRYDVLVVHFQPDQWPSVVADERLRAGHAFKTVGYMAWETTSVPGTWAPYLTAVDTIAVPCRWNVDVIQKVVPERRVVAMHHVVESPLSVADADSPRTPVPVPPREPSVGDDVYMFYTINEWNARKGVDDLLRCYHACFTALDPVVLFVKTGGDVSPRDGAAFLTRIRREYARPPRVILQFGVLTDAQIRALHRRGNCYVSLTKGEAAGLGMLEAAAAGKPVITNSFGGQVDYLEGCWFTKYTLQPVLPCIPYNSRHNSRMREDGVPQCEKCRLYGNDQQWGQPDLEDAQEFMKSMFRERRRAGEPATRRHIETHFSYPAIGAAYRLFLAGVVDRSS